MAVLTHSSGHLTHSAKDFIELFALPELHSNRTVSTQIAGAGKQQVSYPGKAEKVRG